MHMCPLVAFVVISTDLSGQKPRGQVRMHRVHCTRDPRQCNINQCTGLKLEITHYICVLLLILQQLALISQGKSHNVESGDCIREPRQCNITQCTGLKLEITQYTCVPLSLLQQFAQTSESKSYSEESEDCIREPRQCNTTQCTGLKSGNYTMQMCPLTFLVISIYL